MKLLRIWATNIHGHLSFDIKLNSGLNILVGINGSGKTSALNIVNMLTKPDYAAIITSDFQEIGVELLDPLQKKIVIKALQGANEVNINCIHGKKAFKPINIKADHDPQKLSKNRALRERAYEEYQALRPEPHERETWIFLEQLAKPLTISLDRRITVNKGSQQASDDDSDEGFAFRTRRLKQTSDTIGQVTAIARDQHSKQKSDLLALNEKLKSKIVTSTFTQTSTNTKIPTTQQINELEQKLKQQVESWSSESKDLDSITSYFKKINRFLEALGNKNPKNLNTILSNMLSDDMRRISSLSEAFETFEIESTQAKRQIKQYLDALNSFFIDSKKSILFNEESSLIQFKTNGISPTEGGVDLLSSGEKQLLILLTLVAFPPNSATTFIIDEPEISLHPKWQHQLLPSITELMNTKCQMIIATHSPELVGPFRKQCISL